MPPCAEPRCAALAVDGDRCAVHRQGLHQHHVPPETENTLRCGRCRRLVREGDWYQKADGAVTHVHACPPRE